MYFEPDTRESRRLQAEIDKLDAEKARADAELLNYLKELRISLGQRYGTEVAPDSSRG